MTLAISSHGTIVAMQLTPGGAFTDIAELGDVTPPALTRNEFDATTQEKDIDSYVLGVMRRGAFTGQLNFLPGTGTHDHLTGLYYHMINNIYTGYRFTFPDAASTTWIASGQVQSITPAAPVDGKLSCNFTLRFSGAMSIGGVAVGA
jgi:hypothetical protein